MDTVVIVRNSSINYTLSYYVLKIFLHCIITDVLLELQFKIHFILRLEHVHSIIKNSSRLPIADSNYGSPACWHDL